MGKWGPPQVLQGGALVSNLAGQQLFKQVNLVNGMKLMRMKVTKPRQNQVKISAPTSVYPETRKHLLQGGRRGRAATQKSTLEGLARHFAICKHQRQPE